MCFVLLSHSSFNGIINITYSQTTFVPFHTYNAAQYESLIKYGLYHMMYQFVFNNL